MSTSKTLHFDTKENMAERNVIRLTQEVVRGLLGLDDARVDRRFDRVYQVLATIYSKYETQLDQMESILAVNDLETSVQTFSGVMDNLFSDGHINPGRVAMVLVFASRMVQHCIKKEIILSNNVDQLAEAIGIQIAARLTKSPFMMVRLRFVTAIHVWFEVSFVFALSLNPHETVQMTVIVTMIRVICCQPVTKL